MAVSVLDPRALPAGNYAHALPGLEDLHPGLHDGDRSPVVETHEELVARPRSDGVLEDPGKPGGVASQLHLAHALDDSVGGCIERGAGVAGA